MHVETRTGRDNKCGGVEQVVFSGGFATNIIGERGMFEVLKIEVRSVEVVGGYVVARRTELKIDQY